MTLDEIPSGATVYVDANIFVYKFTRQSDQCRLFLARCRRTDLHGVTGSHVILEVAHRLMMVEAVDRGLISGRNIPSKLKRRPELVASLGDTRRWIEAVADFNITVLVPTWPIIESSPFWQRRYGLLVNDSVSAAMMDEHDITTIATNDRDFERIEGLSVHIPTDL